MVFSSAIYLFAFFPAAYAVYRLTPGIRAKNAVLLCVSLVFYCFGGLTRAPVLLASIFVNWGAGRVLGAWDKAKKPARRAVMTLTAALNVGLLVCCKYLGFFAETLNALTGLSLPVPSIALPLGVSFFTFTGLGYVIEVYRRPSNVSRNLIDTALYIALFPTILSGPILSWKSTAPQLRDRSCTPEKTARGLRRFVLGLSKKLLIADVVGAFVDAVYAGAAVDARAAWLGALGYAVQIYFDFSGYTDMALGVAAVFGFELPENFSQPYTALGMTDFWKRWHISLTTWFRNYLYMPIVMAKPQQRLYKKWAAKHGRPTANRLAILIPSAVVWLLTGLWHGAAWSFVLWGLWHGLFCVLEGVGVIRTDGLAKSRGGRAVLRAYTIAVILVGTVLFRAESLAQAGSMLAAMAAGWRFTAAGTLLLQRSLTGLVVFCLAAGIVGCLPVVPWLRAHTGRWGEPASYAVCAALLALCVMSIAANGFQPFIYLQF